VHALWPSARGGSIFAVSAAQTVCEAEQRQQTVPRAPLTHLAKRPTRSSLRSVLAWMVPARLPSAPVEQRRKRRLVIESSGGTRSVARDERSDVRREEVALNPFALNE
jgi:hypothetical protein